MKRNDRSLAEQAKALLDESDYPETETEKHFRVTEAQAYAHLEIARQLGRIANALETANKLPHH